MLEPLLPVQYLVYLQVAEVAVVGYFIIQMLSKIFYRLALIHSKPTADSIKTLVRLGGAIIVIAFIISYLIQDPIIAASMTTISGLVIGFSAANLIGNVIAGMYLAITRPFRIGDTITIFGQKGRVVDISLLHTRLLVLENNVDEMLIANSSVIGTWIVIVKGQQDATDIKRDETEPGLIFRRSWQRILNHHSSEA